MVEGGAVVPKKVEPQFYIFPLYPNLRNPYLWKATFAQYQHLQKKNNIYTILTFAQYQH